MWSVVLFKNKRLGLQFKITFLMIIILFVMLAIQNMANIFFVRNISGNLSNQLIEKTLEFNATDTKGLLNAPLNQLDGAKSIIQELINTESIDSRSLEGIMQFLLKSIPDSIGGAGIVFTADAFDNESASQSLNGFSMYLSRNPDGSILDRPFEPAEINSDWYIEPFKTGKVYITDLYYFNVGGKDVLMYTWSQPLFDNNNKVIGVITMDIFTSDIQNSIQGAISLEKSSITIISHTGAIVSIGEGFVKDIGKNIYDVFPNYKKYDIFGRNNSGKYSTFTGKDLANGKDTIYALIPIDVGDGKYWSIILSILEKDLYKETNNSVSTMLIIAFIITVVLGFLIALVIKKKFTFIMDLLAKYLGRFASGDLSLIIPPPLIQMNDEWGDIAKAFDFLVKKINEIITKVKNSSMEIEAAANEVTNGNIDLSRRTEMQAASVEETASSMLEMGSTIKRSSTNSVEANEMMNSSKAAVKEASVIISDTTRNIEEVLEASSKIGNITKIIESIAFQTNILALNAAVEAARAGEQGRGFAVVASEVRNLAQTTQSSVKDITDLVVDVNEKIKKSTETVYKSKIIFDEVEEKIEKSSTLMSEISETALEQQSGIEEVNKAVAEIDMTTQQNAALVEEAAASSQALLEQAKQLVDAVSFFKMGDGND